MVYYVNNLRFKDLIMISDFKQVLHSAREFYTKKYYFYNHKLFSTISLLQQQGLNPRNYSKKELIMELFPYTTDNGMHMLANIQSITKCRYL
jgi:hypothetical protein